MTSVRIIRLCAIPLLMLLCVRADGQPSSLSGLQSPDDDVRIAAFYTLMGPADDAPFNAADRTSQLLREYPAQRAAIVQTLAGLLARENVRTQRSFDEKFSHYYGDLIWSVASLHDALAIDPLLGAVQTGNLATDGLAAFGEVALPSVLLALETGDSGTRNGVLRVLSKLAKPDAPPPLAAESRATVRGALLRGTEDEDPFNREVSIRGLAHFSDAAVRNAILTSSVSDASERVRAVANEWLHMHPSQ